MKNTRLIARLDVKAPNLVKGIQMEGLRVLGDPCLFARKYYEQGIDELIYIDIVASLYNRNGLADVVKKTAQEIFIPLTVGGGIRTISDIREMLRAGADKVAINTAAIANPNLIKEAANSFGSQCIVISIEAKQNENGRWEALFDSGREHSHLDVEEWAVRAAELGAGEILLTSVDREGTKKGFDLNLIKRISSKVSIPVIASGGMGKLEHLKAAICEGEASAVAMANVLHYNLFSLAEIRDYARSEGLVVR